MASTWPSTQKPNFDVFGKKLQKISCKTFHRIKLVCLILSISLQPFVQDCRCGMIVEQAAVEGVSFDRFTNEKAIVGLEPKDKKLKDE